MTRRGDWGNKDLSKLLKNPQKSRALVENAVLLCKAGDFVPRFKKELEGSKECPGSEKTHGKE